jgi:hypothetical protein
VREVTAEDIKEWRHYHAARARSVNRLHICRLLTNGVDAPTVMEYSRRKGYPSFSVYLHKTEWGEKRACLIVETVDHFLSTSGAPKTNGAEETTSAAMPEVLTNHRTAYPARLIAL